MSIKNDIIEVGKRLYHREMVSYHDGNISAKEGDKIYITGTMISKGFMLESDIIVVDKSGEKLAGMKAPSTELSMHLAIYNANSKINAIVHAHPINATAFSVIGRAIDKFYTPETEKALGVIPVAEFAPSGSLELAKNIAKYANNYNGVLLKNHGAIAWADDIYKAYYIIEQLESYCKMITKIEWLNKVLND